GLGHLGQHAECRHRVEPLGALRPDLEPQIPGVVEGAESLIHRAAVYARAAPAHSSWRVRKLTRPRLATMTWSMTPIPTSSPTSTRRRVMERSSSLGSGSPLGWLWTSPTLA